MLGRPEHELLLCCVGPVESKELADRIRHLASGDLDWDYLFRLARRHAVVSLVFNRLQLSSVDVVPANHLVKFRQYFQENAARNVLLTAELCRLIKVLAVTASRPFLTKDLRLRSSLTAIRLFVVTSIST
jgi:hypothetical protein